MTHIHKFTDPTITTCFNVNLLVDRLTRETKETLIRLPLEGTPNDVLFGVAQLALALNFLEDATEKHLVEAREEA